MPRLPHGQSAFARGDDEAFLPALDFLGTVHLQLGKMLWKAAIGAAMLAWAALGCAAPGPDIPPAQDLRHDAEEARRAGVPLVLFYSSPSCPYCITVREEFLLPLQRQRGGPAALMRRVDVDSDAAALDFDGRPTTHAEFARRRHVGMVPTLGFYGWEGTQLAEPIVGLLTPDFYGAYVDRAIAEARARLEKKP